MAKQPSFISNVVASFMGRGVPTARVSPFKEAGRSGTAAFGGYIEVIERSPLLQPGTRYITAADILANVSIVAASIRYTLNLIAKPKWTVKAAEDMGEGESSDAAKKAAEFVEDVLHDMETSWTRIVRRSGMYRYHGFGFQEWTAKRREDGLIGMLDIEPRPQHTIEQWELDVSGKVLGVWQRAPQDSGLYWLPRDKLVYLVDDSLTDSPEGMGLFRHLVEPAEAIKRYLKLEGQGFERDLRGIPVGRAPLSHINQAVEAGEITKEEAAALIYGLRKFVQLQVKQQDTGLIVDSRPYEGTTADGTTVSSTPMWGLELLTAQSNAFADLGKAIERLTLDIARICGTEGIVLGAAGGGANRSLAEDKSRNLYLNIDGATGDLSDAFERDVIGPLWKLNGLPDSLKPTLEVEASQAKDVEQVAAVLRDMAAAGAVLEADDPAIDDVRDLIGLSHQPEMTPERMEMLHPAPVLPPSGPGAGGQAAPGEPAAPPQAKLTPPAKKEAK